MNAKPMILQHSFRLASFSVVFGLAFVSARTATGQAEWVSRIDEDGNGYIEPDEVSDRAREYLERFAKPYGLKLTRPQSVRILEEAARRYYANRDNDRSSVVGLGDSGPALKGFDADEDRPVLPGFGAGEIRYPYTAEDLDSARGLLRRYDSNDDGFIDAAESEEIRWRDVSPRVTDIDGDQRLSLSELAQRYSRRRMEERIRSSAIRIEAPEPSSRDNNSWRERRSSRMSAGDSRNGDRGTRSLADSILSRYDFNRNGQLDASEMASVGIPMTAVDFDRSSGVDTSELASYLFEQFELEANSNEELIPTWFFERDLNGDDQVELGEFAETLTPEDLKEFASFDANRDGLITNNEVIQSKTVVGGTFSNRQASVLLPRSTIVSEIDVPDDFILGDLNVQLSISHTFVSQLDGYLISPDGERVELFSGVGGSDDHFEKTIFDDEAGNDITRGRPPFEGSYKPGALRKRKPGLSQFRGKSIQGVWQLMLRCSRSERSGVLHGWSMIAKPAREQIDNLSVPKDEASEEEEQSQEAKAETEQSTPAGETRRPEFSRRDRRE